MINNDYLFQERDVSDKVFKTDLYPDPSEVLIKKDGVFSFALPLSFGSVYIVRFNELPEEIRAVRYQSDNCAYELCPDLPFDTVRDFVCTPVKENELLLMNINRLVSFKVFEAPVIISGDTNDTWFYYLRISCNCSSCCWNRHGHRINIYQRNRKWNEEIYYLFISFSFPAQINRRTL